MFRVTLDVTASCHLSTVILLVPLRADVLTVDSLQLSALDMIWRPLVVWRRRCSVLLFEMYITAEMTVGCYGNTLNPDEVCLHFSGICPAAQKNKNQIKN